MTSVPPLRAIHNIAGWIESDIGDNTTPAVHENIQLLRQRANRMEKLLDDILQYSRVGRGKSLVATFTITSLLEEIKQTINIPEDFTLSFEGDNSTITSYKAPLQQVLSNLIDNAIKHHDRKNATPLIIVSCKTLTDSVQISVKDNGPGIPERFHTKAFAMFKTLKSRDRVEGSGMGLAFVKKIVELHGGSVQLTSQVGVGSEFTFTWKSESINHKDEYQSITQNSSR